MSAAEREACVLEMFEAAAMLWGVAAAVRLVSAACGEADAERARAIVEPRTLAAAAASEAEMVKWRAAADGKPAESGATWELWAEILRADALGAESWQDVPRGRWNGDDRDLVLGEALAALAKKAGIL